MDEEIEEIKSQSKEKPKSKEKSKSKEKPKSKEKSKSNEKPKSKEKSKSKGKLKKISRKTKKLISNLKKPKTPYFVFCQKVREEQKKQNENKKLSAKELGLMWNRLSDIEKKIYISQYEEEKKKYDKLKEEIVAKSDEDNSNEENEEEEETKKTKNTKKISKNKIKIKKAVVDRNNAKACNCGKCSECKKLKSKSKDDDSDEDDDNE